MKKIYFILPVSFFLFSNCKIAEKQFRQGDYEQAIEISIKKLQRNPDKEDYILILEEAFKRSNQNDLAQIHTLNIEGQPDRWEEIYYIYQNISRRQHKIEPLIPLYLVSEERDASFVFVDVVNELIKSKKNAIQYWNASADQKLESENKYEAREAYYLLKKIQNLDANFIGINQKLFEAKQAGMNYVNFEVKNVSKDLIPENVLNALFQIQPQNLSGNWFEIENNFSSVYDYKIVFEITQIESLPEKISSNNYQESKIIEDGFAYIYDEKGNIVKDSLGNALTTPKYETVYAFVHETWQEKIASIEGNLKYIDLRNGKTIKIIPVRGDKIFTNYYAVASGYYNALSSSSKQKIGGGPLPFPSDEILIIESIKTIEQMMQNAMQDWNQELLNG